MDFIKFYDKQPEGFNSQVSCVACHIGFGDKLLLLKRSPSSLQPNTWCVPGGKIEPKESPQQAAIRELCEETGIVLHASSLQEFHTFYVHKPDFSYICHLFHARITWLPEVQLSHEHTEYLWVTPSESEQLTLISGGKETLQRYYIHSQEVL